MIKFFRHIRKSLISENKMSKYFKYAIGEIILVMIGILLALQVNNWNQNRIEKNEETEIIAKLHTEFQENKKNVEEFIEELNNEINSQIELMNLIGVSKEELYKHNLDSIFFSSFGAGEVAFADNTVKNIIQSGRLNVLKNEKISALLIKWNTLSEIRQARLLKLDDWVNNYFSPYLLSKISFKEMDANGNYKWGGTSKIKPNYHPLFQEIEFENHLDNSLWFHQQLFERCIETDQLIDEIIEATKPND
jgi:uncharacterized membrane-anchored protein YhcB (DUF1043 family)